MTTLPILMYHGVIADDCPWSQWTQLPLAQFRRQMDILAKHYNVISLSECLKAILSRGKLPPRSAVITFDDGFRNVYARAYPVLQEKRLPATVFLTTGLLDDGSLLWTDELFCLFESTQCTRLNLTSVGLSAWSWSSVQEREQVYLEILGLLKSVSASRKDEALDSFREQLGPVSDSCTTAGEFRGMSWNEAREMRDSGLIEFGGHTVTHQILSQLDAKSQEREVLESCSRVRDELGQVSPVFCYPNGRVEDFTGWTVRCVQAAGLTGAVSTIEGLADASQNPFELRRIPVGNDTPLWRYRLACRGSIDWLQRVRRRLKNCWSRVVAR